MITANEIRRTFLDYFARHGHEIVASSPLVPRNDPTLMFTNAGMVQFKNVFTGAGDPALRPGRDLAEVRARRRQAQRPGECRLHRPASHLLRDAGQLLLRRLLQGSGHRAGLDPGDTREFGLDPKDRLLVTVYAEDDEAAMPLARKSPDCPTRPDPAASPTSDNFWSMGDTGPCGPCSEIFYDHGPASSPAARRAAPDEDGDRFTEIWNLVFMQFEQLDRRNSGSRTAQALGGHRHGAGANRRRPPGQTRQLRHRPAAGHIIEASAEISGVDPDGPQSVSHRVIADHLRASSAFLIADGVLAQSNEGRGYGAAPDHAPGHAPRASTSAGSGPACCGAWCPPWCGRWASTSASCSGAEALIAETLRVGGDPASTSTLDRGLKLLDRARSAQAWARVKRLRGEVAFKLYDTTAFPWT